MNCSTIMKTLSVLFLLFLTGCWDKAELEARGFIMGMAIDQAENGQFEVVTQVYKPSQPTQSQGGPRYINIETKDDSVFEAIQDIPIHLGRRGQWSHMEVIVIGEKVAKNKSMGDILDFIYRNPVIRLTSALLITKGKASKYLENKPVIENTMSEQLFELQESAALYNAKVPYSNLMMLGERMNSEVDNTVLPYVYLRKNSKKAPLVAGAALFRKGKMIDTISSKHIEMLNVLMNEYKKGILQFPCTKKAEEKDSFEVVSLKTKLSPIIKGDSVTTNVSIKITGNVGEMHCSSVTTPEEEQHFIENMKKTIKKDLEDTIKLLQEKKIDVLEIGNQIYRKDPALWKQWKKNWDKRFADSQFVIDIDAKVLSTGTRNGIPLFEK